MVARAVLILFGLALGITLAQLSSMFGYQLKEVVKILAVLSVVVLVLYLLLYLFNQSKIQQIKQQFKNLSPEEIISSPKRMATLLFTYGASFITLGTVFSLLTSIALLATVTVGYLQVDRLTSQNMILERQLPLLLRQSIMSNSNQLLSLNQRLNNTNEAIIKLQGIQASFNSISSGATEDFCDYVSNNINNETEINIKPYNCESIEGENLSSYAIGDTDSKDNVQVNAHLIMWLSDLSNRLSKASRDNINIKNIEDRSAFYSNNNLIDIISFCDLPSEMATYILKELYSIKEFEISFKLGSEKYNNGILFEYINSLNRLFGVVGQKYRIDEVIEVVLEKYKALSLGIDKSVKFCSMRVTILAQEKGLLQNAIDKDNEDLLNLQKKGSKDADQEI